MFRELYIHVPFCLKKCDYCAFYSIENSTAALRERWLDRIIFDLELHRDRLQDLQSVYFGGGTPTLPDTDFLERMFHRILRSGIIGLQRDAEITSEANPETINGEKAALLTRYVNRISMGVQSFHPEKRAVLGRRPASAEHVFTAVEHLRKNGLANLGFDLMYAVPGETLEDWTADLRQAAALAPEHLSAYALTPEERTPYADRHGLKPPDDELSSAMWHRAGALRKIGNEYGATTGRNRRCGWFDAPVVRKAAVVNGLTHLAITKLDVLDTFDTIKICTHYECDGEKIENFPNQLSKVGRCVPVYEEMPGWKCLCLCDFASLLADLNHVSAKSGRDTGKVEPIGALKNSVPVKICGSSLGNCRVCAIVNANAASL